MELRGQGTPDYIGASLSGKYEICGGEIGLWTSKLTKFELICVKVYRHSDKDESFVHLTHK